MFLVLVCGPNWGCGHVIERFDTMGEAEKYVEETKQTLSDPGEFAYRSFQIVNILKEESWECNRKKSCT